MYKQKQKLLLRANFSSILQIIYKKAMAGTKPITLGPVKEAHSHLRSTVAEDVRALALTLVTDTRDFVVRMRSVRRLHGHSVVLKASFYLPVAN